MGNKQKKLKELMSLDESNKEKETNTKDAQSNRQYQKLKSHFIVDKNQPMNELFLKEVKKDYKSVNMDEITRFLQTLQFTDDQPGGKKVISEQLSIVDEISEMNIVHYCCRYGHLEIMVNVLQHDPSLSNKQDMMGNTPLHHLCLNTMSGKQDLLIMVEHLIERDQVALRLVESEAKEKGMKMIKTPQTIEQIKNKLGLTPYMMVSDRIRE